MNIGGGGGTTGAGDVTTGFAATTNTMPRMSKASTPGIAKFEADPSTEEVDLARVPVSTSSSSSLSI
jgi:hypothetical protein